MMHLKPVKLLPQLSYLVAKLNLLGIAYGPILLKLESNTLQKVLLIGEL